MLYRFKRYACGKEFPRKTVAVENFSKVAKFYTSRSSQ